MKKLKVLTLFLIGFFVFLIPNNIKAQEQEGVKEGDQILLHITIQESQDFGKISYLRGDIVYDSDIFNIQGVDAIDASSQLSDIVFNEDTISMKHIASGEDATFSMQLDVKEGVEASLEEIVFENITFYNGEQSIDIEDVVYEVQVVENQSSKEFEGNRVEMQSEIEVEDVVQTNPFLYIGIASSVIGLLLLIIFLRKKDKKGMCVIGVVFIAAGIIVLLTTVRFSNYDVNDDGLVNQEDADTLQQYLLELDETILIEEDSSIQVDYDVNSDGRIDYNDLSHLQNRVDKEELEDFNIEFIDARVYYAHGEEVSVSFRLLNHAGYSISSLWINGEEIQPEYNAYADTYFVTLDQLVEAGVYDINISEVQLNNGAIFKDVVSTQIEILKRDVSMNDFDVVYEQSDKEASITFDIVNEDSANISDSSISVRALDNVVYNGELINAHNIHTIDVNYNTQYQVDVELVYEIDSDTLQPAQDHSRIVTYSYLFQVLEDGSVEVARVDEGLDTLQEIHLTHVNILNAQEEIITTLPKEEIYIISLQYDIIGNQRVDEVEINDVYYPLIEKEDGEVWYPENNSISKTYYVKMPAFTTSGLKEIHVGDSKLSDQTQIETSVSTSIEVVKEQPNVDVEVIVGSDGNYIVSYDIEDNDHTISTLSFEVFNAKNESVMQANMPLHENEVNMDSTMFEEGTYTIKVNAVYALQEGVNQQREVAINTFEVALDLSIQSIVVDKMHIEKNDVIMITFTVLDNTSQIVDSLVVNNTIVDVSQVEDNTYMAQLRINDATAGPYPIVVNAVYLQDGREVICSGNTQIEVLKSPFIINEVSITEDIYAETISLQLLVEDNDESYVSANIQVKNASDFVVFEESVVVGENSFEIPVEIGAQYDVQVNASYKRDSMETVLVQDVLYTQHISLVEEYDVFVRALYTKNEADETTNFFNKSQAHTLYFSMTNASAYGPQSVLINDQSYTVHESGIEDVYFVELQASDEAGLYTYELESITLENGYQEELSISHDIDVLKDVPTAGDFTYDILEDGNVRVYINIENEEAVIHYIVRVSAGDSNIYTSEALGKDIQYIDFTPNTHELYQVSIEVQYDLDSNLLSEDEHIYNEVLVNETVYKVQEFIELKDVSDVKLFKAEGGSTIQLNEVQLDALNTKDYFVQVQDGQGNQRYADVVGYEVIEDSLYFTLAIEDSITYGEDIQTQSVVRFGQVHEQVASTMNFESFIEAMKANPDATIQLTQDIDASNYASSTSTYVENFNGSIEGNGYTIKNLNRPLFNNINGASIQNLIIEDANVTDRSILALTSQGSVQIDNVHIKDAMLLSSGNVAAFVASALDGSDLTITKSSISNIIIQGGKRTGGMVGQQRGKLTISDSYIQGSMSVNSDAVGGVLGEIYGEVIFDTLYVDMLMQADGNNARGGVVGYGGWSNDYMSNVISLADGVDGNDGFKFTGNGSYHFTNNYVLEESTLADSNYSGITSISRDDITREFLENNVGFDATIWDLDALQVAGEMPKLLGLDAESEIETSVADGLYVANYAYVSTLEEYDEARTYAYHNMNMLMPHLDSKSIIRNANTIPVDHVLNTQRIEKVYPIDASGNLVVGLHKSIQDSIKSIRIIMEDGSEIAYTTTYEKTLDSVPVYKVNELGIKYNYPKLAMNDTNAFVDELVAIAQEYDYMDDISILTPEVEDRLYSDYYTMYFTPKLEEKVYNILETMPMYTFTSDSENIINKIRQDLLSDNTLESILYSANYYDRYYHFDIGIAQDLSDILFFESDLYSETKVSAAMLSLATLQTSENNRAKNKSIDFYNSIVKANNGNKNIGDFLQQYVQELTSYEDAATWFADTFEGVIEERKLQNPDLQEIRYTAWDHMNTKSHMLLPILSMPEDAQEDLYIISVPTQITIGSLHRYDLYNQGDIETLKQHISHYADMALSFYEVSATYQPNADKWLNELTNIQYDTRFNFPISSPTPGDQAISTTEESVIKWVYDTMGVQAAANGSGAYANGYDVFWVSYSVLWSDFSFSVWTHETAHNQDGRYFYDGNGRRLHSGAEDHADYNIAQNMKEGHFTPNLRYDLPTTSDLSINLNLDRITSPEKIHSFYDNMFDAYYVLDYLTAQAFFQLTPEQQAALVTQVSYLDAAGNESMIATADTTITRYSELSAMELEAMNLQTMQDLWDNQLVLRASGDVGRNLYGSITHYDILWYHPHNDAGMVDGTVFKKTSYEMLGVGGIEGRIAYASYMHNNDLDALKDVTNDSSITWESYKMERWNEVEENLSNIDYFDSEAVIALYVEALSKDASTQEHNHTDTLRNVLYNVMKHDSEDFDKGSDAYTLNYQHEIASAQELVDAVNANPWGSYVLVNDLDFSSVLLNEQTHSYITNTFVGVLDGGGHTITGLSGSLFDEAVYAHVKDIQFVNLVVEEGDTAILANRVEHSISDAISIQNINYYLPLYASMHGNNIELIATTYDVSVEEIYTLQDILAIENDTTGLMRSASYKLMADIDMSGIEGTQAIISEEFSGSFDGNGFAFTSLKQPLFENITGQVVDVMITSTDVPVSKTTFGLLAEKTIGGTIHDVSIEGAHINARAHDQVGILLGYANLANIQNITIEQSSIEANNEVGGIVGKVENSTLQTIRVHQLQLIVKLYYGGGVAGRAHNTRIENVYAQGSVTTNKTHSAGVVGVLRDASILRNVVSNMEVQKIDSSDSRNSNGGIVGGYESGGASVENVIQVANVGETIHKIISNDANEHDSVIQGYEITSLSGISSENGAIQEVSFNMLTQDFYVNTLGFDTSVWDYTNIHTLGYPTLK